MKRDNYYIIIAAVMIVIGSVGVVFDVIKNNTCALTILSSLGGAVGAISEA